MKDNLRILSVPIIAMLLIAGCTSKEKDETPAVIGLYSGSVYNQNMYYKNVMADSKTTIYHLSGFDTTVAIKHLKKGAGLQILGETSRLDEKRYGRGFYLVKYAKDSNIWTGWIEKSAISQNIDDPRRFLPLSSEEVSFDNELLAICTGHDGGFKVLKRTGELVSDLPFEKLRLSVPDAYDGIILGWADDSRFAWAEVNIDAHIVCFIRLKAEDGSYEILNVPDAFDGYQVSINLNNGNILYTDYPFQYSTENAEGTRSGGKPFYLYRANLLDGTSEVIASNNGAGFELEEIRRGEILCKKENSTESFLVNLN